MGHHISNASHHFYKESKELGRSPTKNSRLYNRNYVQELNPPQMKVRINPTNSSSLFTQYQYRQLSPKKQVRPAPSETSSQARTPVNRD